MDRVRALRDVLAFFDQYRVKYRRALSYSFPKNGKDNTFVIIDGLKISNAAWEQLTVIARRDGYDVVSHDKYEVNL